MLSGYETLHQLVTGHEVPEGVVQRDSAADVIGPGRGFIGAFHFTMQLQVGCPGGCLYCYVPASFRLTPKAVRDNWGFEVRTKRRATEKFRDHLRAGTLADKTVYWSGVTDPYAAPPHLTRSIWQVLGGTPQHLRPQRLAVQSRFAVQRDVDLIAEYCRTTATTDDGPPVVISYSIGTDRTEVIRAWERATPSFEQRMRNVKKLCESGIFVVVTLSPFGPWNDLPGTLRQLRAWGVPYVTLIFFKQENHCASTPPRFLQYLRDEWPELLCPTWQAERLDEIESIYGPDRALQEQAGFTSLIAPQHVVPVVTWQKGQWNSCCHQGVTRNVRANR